MSNTTQPDAQVCTHERRPGTTVCLHCRHAARIAAADRRKKLALRGTAGAIVVAVIAATGTVSATAIRAKLATKSPETTGNLVASAKASDSTASAAPAATTTADQTPAAPVVQAGEAARVAPFGPTIAMGESMLADSVLATRTDSAVVLSFDRSMLRTRMPMKFELFLRSTLKQVYGPAVDSVLARIPDGSIASQGDLLNDLPTRGIHLPISEAWSIDVYPETRQGQDGPLVVRYRTAVVAKS